MPDEQVITPGLLRQWPLPSVSGDKEARGRLLVIGGSTRIPGAVVLAAEAAMRSGAGKLQIATVDTVAVPMALRIPEAMVAGLPTTKRGELDPAGADELVELANDCRAVLIGPGMGDADAAAALLSAVVPRLSTTVVLDAVALAYLTEHPDGLAHLDGRAIVSPNLSELGLTLGLDDDEAAADPRRHAQTLADRAQAVVTTGADQTWVTEPAGRIWRDDSGVPALATSGSGDVKAGAVAGLAVRGADPAQAAVWATYAHGRAGERRAASGGPVGFLARDLLIELPHVLAEVCAS